MRKNYKQIGSFGLFIAIGGLLLFAQPALAMRLVRYQISLDGKPVLETSGGDNGNSDADAIWSKLKGSKLRPVRGFKVAADANDPFRATLKGKVVVEELYGGRAETDELPLVREKANDSWTIAPAEIDRTLKARHKPFRFSISVDGKAVLWSDLQSDTGNAAEDAGSLWRNLKRLELRPINRYKVDADSGDPLRATLKGKLIIHEYYAGHDGGRAEVPELKFVRDKENARWRIAPDDVERSFKNRDKAK
jgi:hypothetical protein